MCSLVRMQDILQNVLGPFDLRYHLISVSIYFFPDHLSVGKSEVLKVIHYHVGVNMWF